MRNPPFSRELRYIGWSPRISFGRKIYLAVEFTFLFLMVPVLIFYSWIPFSKIGALFGFTLLCAFLLWRDKYFNRRKLWKTEGLKKTARSIVLRFIPAAIILTVIIALLEPGQLFNLVLSDFRTWLFIVILYPLFSVYPQELIYRAFLFQRYQGIFPRQRFMIHVSALSFGYLHIIFENYPAIFLTYAAGYLFGRTYAESKSLLAVWFEHTLYGVLIFTIGFNHYFLDPTVLDLRIWANLAFHAENILAYFQ